VTDPQQLAGRPPKPYPRGSDEPPPTQVPFSPPTHHRLLPLCRFSTAFYVYGCCRQQGKTRSSVAATLSRRATVLSGLRWLRTRRSTSHPTQPPWGTPWDASRWHPNPPGAPKANLLPDMPRRVVRASGLVTTAEGNVGSRTGVVLTSSCLKLFSTPAKQAMGHKPDDECVPAQWNHPRYPYASHASADHASSPQPHRAGWKSPVFRRGYAHAKSAGGRLGQAAATHDTRLWVCAPRDARPCLGTRPAHWDAGLHANYGGQGTVRPTLRTQSWSTRTGRTTWVSRPHGVSPRSLSCRERAPRTTQARNDGAVFATKRHHSHGVRGRPASPSAPAAQLARKRISSGRRPCAFHTIGTGVPCGFRTQRCAVRSTTRPFTSSPANPAAGRGCRGHTAGECTGGPAGGVT